MTALEKEVSFECITVPECHELDGLYYSKITGRIFEAEVFDGTVWIHYADTLESKQIEYWAFELHTLELGYYETLINYKEEL